MTESALTPNARRVLEARYLRRDRERKVSETPERLFERVARAVAQAELLLGDARQAAGWESRFLGLLASLDFLPNSPTLMNAGTALGQLSACFVLPVEDSMESIFEAVKQMALVQRSGGGTGFSFSRLRPAGDLVASTGGAASGPVSFMRIFDCATEYIKQGGRRRGANMGILRVDHPDILEFIRAKSEGSLRNFNLSVAVPDAFMAAVERNDRYPLRHPGTARTVFLASAREIFDAIVSAAWQTGDPGLVFDDAINRDNPTPHLGRLEATNPCGELPLLPHEACTLGSLNLAHMVTPGTPHGTVDWERLGRTVRLAVRFLDDVVEINRHPLPEIERVSRGNRKIGLGVMGFADLLIRIGVSYASEAAVRTADSLMAFIAGEARRASEELAAERGPFPQWCESILSRGAAPVRNASRTAIAPTGTIGIVAGCSAGIEPLFALAYRRRHSLGGEELREVNPLLEGLALEHGLDPDRVLAEVLETGTVERVSGLPEEVKRLLVTALEIAPEQHLRIQAAFQRHVDNAVSKTVNLPRDAGVDTVAGIYRRAWQLGVKGVTVYRYASNPAQVLELAAGDESFHYAHSAKCDPLECRI
jgi:ribonucleoside-diphosphate reductase alpha chain